MNKIVLSIALLLGLCGGKMYAQDESFDLSSQRQESQEIIPVNGSLVDHKGIIINPTPQSMQIDWTKKLVVSQGFRVRDIKKLDNKDYSFLTLSNKRQAPRVSINYGTSLSKRYGVKPISGAYLLTISARGIEIIGHDDVGAFYGLQTLRQLLNSPVASSGSLPFISINDYPSLPSRGVVEGFYGTPWSHEVRLSLIKFYGANKMNTYLYGPKDDPYHRSPHWRAPYPDAQKKQLLELLEACKSARVDFIWAVHPGLDIKWNAEDYQNLLNKFEMMYQLGVRNFAIFFDDIRGEGKDPYKQAALLNQLTHDFVEAKGDVGPLVFCPTDYTKQWANASDEGALAIYGRELNPNVKILWTGDAVCSDITESTLDFVNSRIKRPAYFWWNYPVTDYVQHTLLQGPIYGLDTSLTHNELFGVLSNPMEHGEASKLALYGVADYSWNVSAYNPLDNWNRGISLLAPNAPNAYRTFAIHSTDTQTGYRRDESWETEIFSLDDWNAKKADALYADYCDVEYAGQTLLNGGLPTELLREMKPWLIEFKKLGERGQRAIELGRLYREGNNDPLFWSRYVENLMSMDEVQSYLDHRSGTMKLQPFYETMMNDLSNAFLYKLTGHEANDYKAVTFYPNGTMAITQLMLDNNDSTYYTSGVSQKVNSWIALDLGKPQEVHEVRLLQGRHSNGDTDYFNHATLEYSIDAKEWTPLIQDISKEYEIHWKGAPVMAQYVRLRRLASNNFRYVAVRSFEVNPNTPITTGGVALPADQVVRQRLANDFNITTYYSLDGEMEYELVDPNATHFTLLFGKVQSPVIVQQLNERGDLITSQEVVQSLSVIAKASDEVKRILIKGKINVYELLATGMK